jgi:hypothetical protein
MILAMTVSDQLLGQRALYVTDRCFVVKKFFILLAV